MLNFGMIWIEGGFCCLPSESRRSLRYYYRNKPGTPGLLGSNYKALTLSTSMESPSIFPVMVTFLPATSFTLSCAGML